ncbi:3-carboxy-cis,cis-muconate cycloisomerase [Streptomyces sp. 3211.6]|nr:3-carboxy-cis,cis-muconate cycloisomerase family FAD/NAD(P)-binding protein [Streptomyces sp. 3211.6]RKT06579.1 3-carboxy-cis,cis-muconate cycloisomerase [Streptomyces sp. 3211.6]
MDVSGLTAPGARSPSAVAVVGVGPRGLSLLERLCANARTLPGDARITVHLIDPAEHGPGRVWATGQDRLLLMNTVASQVTVFSDSSVVMDGPVEPGPSLYAWARDLAAGAGAGGAQGHGADRELLAEARALTPDSYPSRAFYGAYLRWAADRVRAAAPPQVELVTHRSAAVACGTDPATGLPWVRLADGTRLPRLAGLVLAQGHVDAEPSALQRKFAAHAAGRGLLYVPPGNPAESDLAAVAAGEPVLLRGLGLNFFDHMTLFTHGRGGTFTQEGDQLVYHPSGREPQLYAGSRRGVPYQARGENQKGPHGRHTPAVLRPEVVESLVKRSAAEGGLDFRQDLWPLIAKETETVYYTGLITARDGREAGAAFRRTWLELPWDGPEERERLEAYGVPATARWDWSRLADGGREGGFGGTAEHRAWLLGRLRGDLARARAGNVDGPFKAALDVLRDLRNEIRLVVDHGGLTARSHRDDLERWYTPLNAFLSIGPPARRIAEMIALIEAGVLTVLGPGTRMDVDPVSGAFAAESAVPGSRVLARVLIEARLPDGDVRRTADPLLRGLLDTGQARPYRITGGPEGMEYETGALAVTRRPYRVVADDGRPHPALYAFGVPTEGLHWVTAAGVRPGVDSVTVGDADALARQLLGLGEAGEEDPVEAHEAHEASGAAGAQPWPARAESGPARAEPEAARAASGSAPAASGAAAVQSGPVAARAGAGREESSSARAVSGAPAVAAPVAAGGAAGPGSGGDVGLLSPVRAGTAAEAATGDGAWLRALLDAEVALVRAQARLGVVPAAAAETVARVAGTAPLPAALLAVRARESANPVVALVEALTEAVAAVDPAAADYVHRGSTSQDIMDTAAVLVAARALETVLADLERCRTALAGLAARHRDTPMPGRTLALHAVPVTFGLKAAGWLEAVAVSAARLRRVRADLPVQLGGAAGTLAGYLEYARLDAPGESGEDYAVRLAEAFADETGLRAPVLPWHTVRTPVAELGAELALACGALGKIAVDVLSLARTEVAEVGEPGPAGRGASSAMPHKRNPVLATMVRSAALQVPAQAAVLAQCLLAEDERPAGVWHAEWQPLRECLRLTGGAAATAAELLEGLAVHPARMRENLALTGALTASERIAAALAPALGKAEARRLVTTCSRRSADEGTALADLLAASARVTEVLDPAEIGALLDPAGYTGASAALVDRALAHYR